MSKKQCFLICFSSFYLKVFVHLREEGILKTRYCRALSLHYAPLPSFNGSCAADDIFFILMFWGGCVLSFFLSLSTIKVILGNSIICHMGVFHDLPSAHLLADFCHWVHYVYASVTLIITSWVSRKGRFVHLTIFLH